MPRRSNNRAHRRRRKDEVIEEPLDEIDEVPEQSAVIEPLVEPPLPYERRVWPQLDEDSKAYWRGLDERIRELESLGSTSSKIEVGEEDDEAALLLRSALSSLSRQIDGCPSEIALATDPELSVVLERLVHFMSGVELRVLADRFAGSYVDLAIDPYASHVVETLLQLGSSVVPQEIAGVKHSPQPDTPELGELPSITESFIGISEELRPVVSQLVYHTHGSHVLCKLLLVLSGCFLEISNRRSKKSSGFREHAGFSKTRNLRHHEQPTEPEGRMVPDSWKTAAGETIQSFRRAKPPDQFTESGPKPAAVHEVGCGFIQVAINVEYAIGVADQPESVNASLLGPSSERRQFLVGLAILPGASHILEIIMKRCSDLVVDMLWTEVFRHEVWGGLYSLGNHSIGNFVVASLLRRLDARQLEDFLQNADMQSLISMIDGTRIGPVKALLDRVAEVHSCEAEVVDLLIRAFGCTESPLDIVPCVIGLNRLELLHKMSQNEVQANLQGTLLVQSWLNLDVPFNEPIIASLLSLPTPSLITMVRHPNSSFILDFFASSAKVPTKQKRAYFNKIARDLAHLAQDRIASKHLSCLWDNSDLFLKEKMGKALAPHHHTLEGSVQGRILIKKMDLPLYLRGPLIKWKDKISANVSKRKAENELPNVTKRQRF